MKLVKTTLAEVAFIPTIGVRQPLPGTPYRGLHQVEAQPKSRPLVPGHFYIEGQRVTSKLGSGSGGNSKDKKGGYKVNFPGMREHVQEGIVRNLKFLINYHAPQF